MRQFLMAVAALALVGGCAQVSGSTYRQQYGQYGRSDGVFQRTDTNGFDWYVNGQHVGSHGRFVYENFADYSDGQLGACMQSDGTACSGTNTEINVVELPSGNKMTVYVVGTVTAPGVDMDAGSLDIAGDQINNEGVELFWSNRYGGDLAAFTVGEQAFYQCATMAIEDASGTDDLQFGWRLYEPIQAAFDSYNTFAAFSVAYGTAANPANVGTETADGGGTTQTASLKTWADNASHTMCIYVSAAGAVTYYWDDLAVPGAVAYSFTAGDIVIPFIKILQDTGLTGEVDLTEWKMGYGTWPANQ